jgi:predicted peroxiredoxin
VVGITNEALLRGHEVSIFAMDSGTRFLEKPEYSGLCRLERVRMAFCTHSAEKENVKTGPLPAEITRGSQFDNALMSSESDVVIVL